MAISSNSHITTFCRPKVEALVEKTANLPIIGVVSSIVKDWIPLVDGYYYCEYFLMEPCWFSLTETGVRHRSVTLACSRCHLSF
jgi:hypothetical protein